MYLARGKRQQGDVTRPLDGRRETPLVGRANARETARDNLAAFRHKALQHAHVFVVDVVDLLGAEFAHFFAAEQFAAPLAGPATWSAGAPLLSGAVFPACPLRPRRRA